MLMVTYVPFIALDFVQRIKFYAMATPLTNMDVQDNHHVITEQGQIMDHSALTHPTVQFTATKQKLCAQQALMTRDVKLLMFAFKKKAISMENFWY